MRNLLLVLSLLFFCTVASNAQTWTGSVSTAWETAANWSTYSTPTTSTDVTIPAAPSGGRFPVIGSANASARNLSIASGAAVSQTGGTLTITTSITNNGTFTAAAGTLQFTGSSVTISGTSSASFPFILIPSNVSISMQNSNSCRGIEFLSSSGSSTFTHANNSSLTVNGNVLINKDNSNITLKTWNINSGTATVNGNVYIGSGTDLNGAVRAAGLLLSTGTLTIIGDLLFQTNPSRPENAVLDLSGTATVNITGSIILTNGTGTLTPGTSSTINFNGTSAQTIPLASAIRYNNINMNNPAGVSISGAVLPNYIIGDVRVQSGVFNNNGYAFAGSAGKTFEVANGATFNISGAAGMVTGFSTKTFGANSTVNYSGTVQTVSAENYGNLTVSGSRGINNVTYSNSGTIGIAGNFSSTATFAGGDNIVAGSTISFNGTTSQNISAFTFNNLTVNKPSGAAVLTGDITVPGTLTFTSGKITTGSNTVYCTGTVSGASQSTGWVNGNLKRNFSGSALSGTFNIGGSNYYSPVTVTFANITTGGGITASVKETAHPDLTASEINANKNIPAYWTIANTGGVAFTTYALGLNWNSTQTYASMSAPIVIVSELSAHSWSTRIPRGTPTSTNVEAEGFSTFGDFVVGEKCVRGTWTGAVNNVWSVAGNWECGIVPSDTTAVILPSGLANYPALNGISTVINNLTLRTGTSLTISNGTLQIKGAATTTGGTIDATNGKIELTGTTAQTLPANLFVSNVVKDLVISNAAGVTLAGDVRITGSLGFGNVNNSVLTTGGFLTLVSTTSNTANVLDITNNGANTGNSIRGLVTVERFVQGKRAYRFFTAPVNTTTSIKENWMENTNNSTISVNNNPVPNYGTHITGTGGNTNGFDASQTNNPSLFTFNNTTQTWAAAANTNGLISAGNGYRMMVRGSRSVDLNSNESATSSTTLRTKGSLVTGTVVMGKAGGGGTPGMPILSSTIGSYSLIANPYASVVDWKKVTLTDVADMFYYYDPTISGTNVRGAYVTYNGVFDTTNNSSSRVDRYLQSGQAVFVQITGPNPSITFEEADKKTTQKLLFRTTNDLPQIGVQLLIPSASPTTNVADGVRVYFSNDFSNNVGKENSYKFTNLDENIAINRNGTALSLEGRQSISGGDSIPLKISQLTQKEYTLKITSDNFPTNVEGYLEDKFLNTTTPLSNGATLVPFSITSDARSSATDRFAIVFETLATLPVRLTGVKAYAKNKGVQVEWTAESESNLDLYVVERSTDAQNFEAIGSAKAQNNTAFSTAYNYFDINPARGTNYYRIKAIEKSGEVKLSEVVKVLNANEKNTISVTNNPVYGNSIKLLFENVDKGNYSVSLINTIGEKVYAGKISYSGGTVYQQLDVKSHLPAGVYQLQLTNGISNKSIQVLIQ